MPSPFVPVSIPLVSGARQDLSDLDADDPSQLSIAQNVVFTARGALKGRPGLVSADAQVQRRGPGTSLSA